MYTGKSGGMFHFGVNESMTAYFHCRWQYCVQELSAELSGCGQLAGSGGARVAEVTDLSCDDHHKGWGCGNHHQVSHHSLPPSSLHTYTLIISSLLSSPPPLYPYIPPPSCLPSYLSIYGITFLPSLLSLTLTSSPPSSPPDPPPHPSTVLHTYPGFF